MLFLPLAIILYCLTGVYCEYAIKGLLDKDYRSFILNLSIAAFLLSVGIFASLVGSYDITGKL